MSLADPDPCKLWLQRAWTDLKSPLAQAEVAPVDLSGDALGVQALMQAVCLGDLATARRLCADANGGALPTLDVAMSWLLTVIECIEHDWQTERRSYTDTLYAFWNLQRLMQQWDAPTAPLDTPRAGETGRILLASAPQCPHHLGVLVVGDHFRAHGWQVQTLLDTQPEALWQAVREQPFDVIGLSVGHDAALKGLGQLIRQLRRASANRGLRVLLGGHVFNAPVAAYDGLGADGVATSAQEALLLSRAWRRRH